MRTCGDCTLCCTLLPVKSIGKVANEPCKFLSRGKHKGCSIYQMRPNECKKWSCAWIAFECATADLRRPDKAHYVIDTMPDFIVLEYSDGRPRTDIAAMQVWCDPAQPDAWRDPPLLALIERQAKKRIATIIRWNSRDSISVWAPPWNDDGSWVEKHPDVLIDEVSPEEKAERAARAMDA